MASLRRRPCSPAAAPLENDDLLAEILLRLPPHHSSLPRASAVSRRWRGLATDPRFCSRFRAHHRRNPPLLGYFLDDLCHVRFEPALQAPNSIPQGRFSFPMEPNYWSQPLGTRHGLVLILHSSWKRLLVWDPVTGDQHHLDIPPGFDIKRNRISAAVFRAAGDVRDFQVALVGSSDMQHTQMVASVYSSKTDRWGNLTTAPVPPADSSGFVPADIHPEIPAVMVGDSFYWVLGVDSFAVLEFNLRRGSLGLIAMPGEEVIGDDMDIADFSVVMAEGGGLGFLFLSGFDAQLWKRKTNCDGVASWALQRTIALDKLHSIKSEKERARPGIIAYAEDNNIVLVWTSTGVFAVNLGSLQFKKLFESDRCYYCYPFEGVYTAEESVKEQNASEDSENLSIAFGLLGTAPVLTLKILKKLIIRGGCHSAAMLISKIED